MTAPAARLPARAQRGCGGVARRRRRIALSVAVPLGAFLVLALVGVLSGAALFVVESPSMGRAAPVGTLVVTAPVAVRDLRVGDVITYRPPLSAATTTHRVVRIVPSGVVVRGDLNGAADVPVVRQAMLVGRAVALLPAVGTLIRLAPWLTIGIASAFLLTWPLRNEELRGALRTIGVSTVLTVVLLVQRPLLAWELLSQRVVHHGMLLELVATGLLPLRVQARGGGDLLLVPGALGTLTAPADTLGRVHFDAALGLEPWGWALLVLVCLAPLLGVLVFGLPARGGDASGQST